MRIVLRAVFGFAELHEKATYGLGYELTLTENNENFVSNNANATNNGKTQTNGF